MAIKAFCRLFIVTIIATGIFCSCKKTVTVPLKSQINLSINADSSSFDMPAASKTTLSTASVTFLSGVLMVNTFKFDATKSGSPTESITPGTGLIDLFTATPNTYTINLDTGAYTNAEIRVKLIKSTGTMPAPLILKGVYKSAGVSIPIEVDFNENTEIRVKIKDQVIVDGLSDVTSTLKLYLNRLFMGVASADIDKTVRTNGAILINSVINRNIYVKVKANILNAVGGDAVQVVVED